MFYTKNETEFTFVSFFKLISLAKLFFLKKSLSVWQGWQDLNPRHAVLETAALPTELHP